MRQRLAPKRIMKALQRGDAQPLIDFHRQTFGDLRMEGDDNADGDDDDDDDDAGDDEDEDDDSSGDDAKSKSKKKVENPRLKELSEEAAKRRNEAKQLKAANEEMAKKLKEFEDAGKGDLEKTQGELAAAVAERDRLSELNRKMALQNAFLMDNKHSWVDPKAALQLADLSEVEIDDEGEVTGMAEALAALAKEKPYLLGKSKDDDDDDDRGGPTGQPVGGSKKKGNPSRDKLVEKYPALRR